MDQIARSFVAYLSRIRHVTLKRSTSVQIESFPNRNRPALCSSCAAVKTDAFSIEPAGVRVGNNQNALMPTARCLMVILAAGFPLVAAPALAQDNEVGFSTNVIRRSTASDPVLEARMSQPATSLKREAAVIPQAPEGVMDLKFGELFKPVGPRGLEHSDRLRGLDGKRVRMLGYMVKQSRPMPWTFLLSPVPVTLHETEYGFAEDMPATVLHVFTPRNATPIVPFTPGLMLLTGTLSVGNKEEPDGRVSTVRLTLDPPTPDQRAAMVQAARSSQTISTNAAIR